MHHSLSLPILLLSSAIVQAAVPESLAIPQAYLDSHPHSVHTTPPPAYAVDRILDGGRPKIKTRKTKNKNNTRVFK
ncbi:hypothetical protein AABD46_17180 [Vibrio parahaemolyticus]|uniref:hypothetical protein n=1 Tax=Vibrio parahaemolyticus TaxID=670 RepID=UPI00311ABCBE